MKPTRTLCVLLILVALAAGCEQPAPKAPPKTRDEVKAMLKDKTKDEVLALMGRPESTTPGLDSGAFARWWYPKASYDPVAKKTDALVEVIWSSDGTVLDVKFTP